MPERFHGEGLRMKRGARKGENRPSVQDAMVVGAAPFPEPNHTLLVAEDEGELRLLLKGFLEGRGYRVILARDGEEAWDLFSRHAREIDLVLLDAVMPKRSGIHVYQQIRTVRKELPCILLTGYSEEVIKRSPHEPVEAPVLQKPVALAELERRIRGVLKNPVARE
jgi:DNA-binding response OmpR family regulator